MRPNRFLAVVVSLAFATPLMADGDSRLPTYRKIQLSREFFAEGAAFGDFNRDGAIDAVAGPYWYAGPDFTARHEIYLAGAFDPLGYSDNFFAFVHDFNADDWPDILVLGFPGTDASWFENPGTRKQPWRRRVVFLPVDGESPVFADLLGTGQPVLLCMSGGRIGYAAWDAKDPGRPWTFHAITPPEPWHRFTHGLGFGDVNGDGRADVLERNGWWEQPASLSGDPIWKHYPFAFGSGRGGAQMFATDVNGDGLADVITALDAHGYGISWFEQSRARDGAISFREHAITSSVGDEKIAGVQFSQPHALALADVDGDRLPDLITGKRWWAHGPKGDVDANGAAVVYAFMLRRGPAGATFEPLRIDDASGVGTQLTTADINTDGAPDLIATNKRGTFVFVSEKNISP